MGRLLLALTAAIALCAADEPQLPRKAPELVINMPGRQLLLSQFRNKVCVVAFMSTTCPHCQHLAGVLAPIEREYGPRGVQVLGVVFNPEANTSLPEFSSTYAKNMFPIGMSTDSVVAAFVQHPPGIHYIPMIAFIDREGNIQSQHLGINDSAFFREDAEDRNIREEIDKLLREPVPASKSEVRKR